MVQNPETNDCGNFALDLHRRQIDALTHPAIKDPRFDEAKQLVIDLLEGRKTGSSSHTDSISFTAVNTDAQDLK